MLSQCCYRKEKKRIRSCLAGHWWLTPVILITWEAEIKRIVVHTCNPNTQEAEQEN
jgi:hypothetical protein